MKIIDIDGGYKVAIHFGKSARRDLLPLVASVMSTDGSVVFWNYRTEAKNWPGKVVVHLFESVEWRSKSAAHSGPVLGIFESGPSGRLVSALVVEDLFHGSGIEDEVEHLSLRLATALLAERYPVLSEEDKVHLPKSQGEVVLKRPTAFGVERLYNGDRVAVLSSEGRYSLVQIREGLVVTEADALVPEPHKGRERKAA